MKKPGIQLSLQTSGLIVGFMVWVLISSLMPYIEEDIALSAGQASLVTSIPVILGSLLRVPIGFYTDRIGARNMFLISFIILLFPVLFISYATSFMDLVIGGLILGVGGAVFSIGVTSIPKYYSKEKVGFVNGIYGTGNIGTAITTFGAPFLAASIGWQSTVRLYLILLLLIAAFMFLFGDRNEERIKKSMVKEIKGVYKNVTLWFLSLFYFITFGAFVAFTMFLPTFLVDNFEMTAIDAGIRTGVFIVLSTLLRPIGGILADKWNAYTILIVVFAAVTLSAIFLSFSPSILGYAIGSLVIGAAIGIGNGTVFKLVPLYFSEQAGTVNGIVSAMGGLGGFFPPILLSLIFSMTGSYAIAFMLLSLLSIASFIIVSFMYYSDKMSKKENSSSPRGGKYSYQ